MDKKKRIVPDFSGNNSSRVDNGDIKPSLNNSQGKSSTPRSESKKRKQKHPSKDDNACGSLTKIDMFGSEYRWNVEGDEVYRTSLGACCSVLLAVIVVIFAIYVFRRAVEVPEFAKLDHFTYRNYFATDTQVRQKQENFFFAVGVSSLNGFDKNQTVSDFITADLKFSLSYKISGGPDDGKTFDIGVRNCT